MKAIKALMLILFSVVSLQLSAQKPQKEIFKVWGNCEMCQSKIEKAAKNVDGVKSARWSVATNQLTVKFNAEKTSVEVIKIAIAQAGYDSQNHRSTDEVYNSLHGCCQYERPEKIK